MLKAEKPKVVDELAGLMDKHTVIGILNMRKLPSRALQQIREDMRGKAVIKMSKKSLIMRAVEKSGKKLDNLELTEVPALVVTNDNPFKLFKFLKTNRTPSSAKTGDIPERDVVVQKGSTGLPPGPSISTLQKIGLKASVQGGKIAVMQDKVVCKAGEMITSDVADVLSLLKIEPIEVGLDLVYVWEDGTVYGKEVLDISTEDYINDMTKCVTSAVNLSVNIGYVTGLTAPIMVQKAFSEARALCVEANILEKGFVDEVLAKAAREAKMLSDKIEEE